MIYNSWYLGGGGGVQTNGAMALLETAHGVLQAHQVELEVYLDEEAVEAEKDLDVGAVAEFPEEDHKGLVVVEEPQTMP